MKITISGASGFIGRRLLKTLSSHGHSLHVLSRHAGVNLPPGVGLSVWDPMKGPPPEESLRGADAVVHLSGEPVAQRWTDEVKRRIRESRVTGTRHLVEGLSKLSQRPAALICASAVGYYGSRGDEILTETSAAGSGYLPEVCVEWENAARAAEPLGMRVTRVRIGLVLDPRGGALQRMITPFRFGVGGRLGDGKQWMSWIHAEDLAAIFRYALENPVQGALNGVAPNPVRNAEFTRALGAALHRPAMFPVPQFGLRLVLGEMASVAVASQRVVPQALESSGFTFRFPQLPETLRDLVR